MHESGCCSKITSSIFPTIARALAWLLPLMMLCPPPLFSQEAESIKIGVLAKRGYEQAVKKWSPTAEYLNNNLPGVSFQIVPLNFDEIREAVAAQSIDFVITNSGYYVHLEYDYGISRIATLKNLVNNVAEKRFGGVIFTQAGRDDINSFEDLDKITFAAVDPDSLGGWQMAWREFKDHDINPHSDFASLSYLGTHDKVVEAVVSGKVDVGTVRTDTLERMTAEGKLNPAHVKIIHPPSPTISFPYLCSTRLYPEWPIAKLRQTPESLAEKVSIALLCMPADSKAAKAASIAGWTVPLDYQPVHELLEDLHLGPYQRHRGAITMFDFFQEHRLGVVLISILFMLLALGIIFTIHLNGKLRVTKANLSKQLAKVQSTERNYQEIFNSTTEAIFIHDFETGAILDVNQAMTDIYGYSASEAISLDVGALSSGTPPYTSDKAAHIIREAMQDGSKTFEWQAKRKDGSLFWVEVNLKPALIGGEKKLLAVVHDISERKEAENELQRYRTRLEEMIRERTADLIKSEASLAEAQRMAHLGSWEWQIAGDSLWWSDETYRIFGLSPEDSPADHETFLKAVHPDDRQKTEEALERAKEGEPYNIEHRIIRPDGTTRIVHEHGKTFFDNGGTAVRMMGTVQDISERKAIEAEQQELRNQLIQSQKLEAIGTLAGGIAHDFNNILGAISGYTELALMKAGENQEITSHLEQVLQAGTRAKELVEQILTFSRKEQLLRQTIDIAEVVEESLKLLRATIPTNIDLQANITTRGSKILADPTQIHQVILNLCTNAYHAMELRQQGVLEVKLSDEELDDKQASAKNLEPGSYVKLSISDTGSGIQPEDLERIFDPFFTTKAKGKGTGMGLSVVHGIIKSCEGVITAQSTPGEGSTFSIYFPKLSEAPKESSKTTAPSSLQKGEERILFVDDEPPLVELGQLILEHLGYEVTALTSSVEALEMIEQQPERFDMLITDQSMPQLTGCQLAQKVAVIRPDLPVVLCSGYGSMLSQDEVKAVGITKFLKKPYDSAHISATIREILDGRS